jgi:hypothetical protein
LDAQAIIPSSSGRPRPTSESDDGTPTGPGRIGSVSSKPETVHLIACPTGSGKTTHVGKYVAQNGFTIWLTDRHEDAATTANMIEQYGGDVGKVVPLRGHTDGVPNCLHPDIIQRWQEKGYDYRKGFCSIQRCCRRQADPDRCPFLGSLRDIKEASIAVFTKAMARKPGFFSKMGNSSRTTVVLDEDPIGLLRPPIEISREDLATYLSLLGKLIQAFEDDEHSARAEAVWSRRVAQWCFDLINRQPAAGQPECVAVPSDLKRTKAVLTRTKRQRRAGRNRLMRAFFRLMRQDPVSTVRNVYRDLRQMVHNAAGNRVFVTSNRILFHLNIRIPRTKGVMILDATANSELLKPLVAPRSVHVIGDERVRPVGRVIQLMDFNGPRSYLNYTPRKLIRIIDAIGDAHPVGTIILISHKSCVANLKDASKHHARIVIAWFGNLRGRNDLEPSSSNRIACHIVAGSPKTTEKDRQEMALAIFGESILPFPDLMTVRRGVVGRIPVELAEGDQYERIWELKVKGYRDLRMQAIYDHTVTAELTHAADRARVLIHQDAVVYLLTNEPCPRLWFAEMCFAWEFLSLEHEHRSDFARNYAVYAAKAKELLDAGGIVGNADVCRALARNPSSGKRYWQRFIDIHGDALEGERKVRWKGE